MTKQWSYKDLEAFGRVRLSDNFYMREFLHSEIAQSYGLLNAPRNPDLAIETGSKLCELILEPIQEVWGKLHVRSGYRSEIVNQTGNDNKHNCANNEKNYAAHIWDVRDGKGFSGATACIVLPKYEDHYEQSGDWVSLAWWIHQNIPEYHEMCFFKNQCSFNIKWYENEDEAKSIRTYAPDPTTQDKKPLVNKGKISSFYDEARINECLEKANALIKA